MNTCVLASYGVACYPFTTTPVLDYFVAYCRHFNKLNETQPKLDEAHPERSYDQHFHNQGNGYAVIKNLHDKSTEPIFQLAKSRIELEQINMKSPADVGRAQTAIKQCDSLLMLFLNTRMHSIVVGYDNGGLFYYDTNMGQVARENQLQELINFDPFCPGDAFLVRKQ
jgi:hypothetical protein